MGDCDMVTFHQSSSVTADEMDVLNKLGVDTTDLHVDSYLTECFVGNTEDDEYIGRRAKSGMLIVCMYYSELLDDSMRDEMWARLTMGLPRR